MGHQVTCPSSVPPAEGAIVRVSMTLPPEPSTCSVCPSRSCQARWSIRPLLPIHHQTQPAHSNSEMSAAARKSLRRIPHTSTPAARGLARPLASPRLEDREPIPPLRFNRNVASSVTDMRSARSCPRGGPTPLIEPPELLGGDRRARVGERVGEDLRSDVAFLSGGDALEERNDRRPIADVLDVRAAVPVEALGQCVQVDVAGDGALG